MQKILCIDIGGTFIKYANCTETGKLDKVLKLPTPHGGFNQLLQCIIKIYRQFSNQLQGIAISIPGTVDSDIGYIYQGGSLQYNNGINLVNILESTLEIPVTIENDAHCATIAEIWKGNLKNRKSGVMLTIGTGIGGTIMIRGKILPGFHRFSGEFSVLLNTEKITPDNFVGSKLSFTKFVKKVQDLKNNVDLTGQDILKLADENDTQVTDLLKVYTQQFAQLIYNLQLTIDPECFVLGGGVSQNTFFESSIQMGVKQFYSSLPIPIPIPDLIVSQFHNDANLIGACRRFLLADKYMKSYIL